MASLSVSGNTRKGDVKGKMSQQNLDTVNDMISERLASLKLDPNEYASRLKMINTHIKNAFANVGKTDKTSTNDEDTQKKIDEQYNSNK